MNISSSFITTCSIDHLVIDAFCFEAFFKGNIEGEALIDGADRCAVGLYFSKGVALVR